MKIVVAKVEDYAIFNELYRRFTCLGTSATTGLDMPEKEFKELAETERILLAYDEDNPIGYVSFTCYDDLCCDLHQVFILPECQRKGWGTQLVDEVIKIAKEVEMAKIRVMSLFVETDHYWMRHCGFRPDEGGYLAKEI